MIVVVDPEVGLARRAYLRPMTATATQPFAPGRWQDEIDVRDFVQPNYTPYDGDGAFLAGPTERTLSGLGATRRPVAGRAPRGGVLDVDAATPASITAHAPGYIDRDRELIVGLQTDAPLKRAIMPYGGLRMVENGLRAYGYEPDPFVRRVFTQLPQDPQRRCLRRLHAGDPRRPQGRDHHRPAGRLRPRPDHRRLPAGRAVRRRPADRGQAGRARRLDDRLSAPTTSSATARNWPSRSGRWAS